MGFLFWQNQNDSLYKTLIGLFCLQCRAVPTTPMNQVKFAVASGASLEL